MRRVFPAYGVRFIAINDNIDTLNESAGDDLTVSVKNIMNEAYARDISIKTRSSLETKRKNGDFVGAFPVYGYRKSEDNHNLLVVDEYAAQVVRSIFRMRLEGFSPYAIANELNRLGTLSPLHIKSIMAFPMPRKAIQTGRIAGGRQILSPGSCRMKPIPVRWSRAERVPSTSN